jgi:hypothetical protein
MQAEHVAQGSSRPLSGIGGAAGAPGRRGVRGYIPARVRVPELALGVFIVAGAALASVIWHGFDRNPVTVVVAAVDLQRGHVIGPDDLAAATVLGAEGITLHPGERAHELLGRRLAVDVAAGGAIAPSLVTDTVALADDEGVVAFALAPGRAPAEIAPGDTVRVAALFRSAAGSVNTELLAVTGVVWSVIPGDEYSPDTLLSLRVPLDSVVDIAAAEDVRIVLVDDEGM